jgi:transcriptional regulator with XRE-family HTH domain
MHSKVYYPVSSYISNDQRSIGNMDNQDLHFGKIVERIVRRDHMGISEIARKLNVSRRTLYNWFNTKRLSFDIICQIGIVIEHDFSKEFPNEFAMRFNAPSAEKDIEAQEAKETPLDAIYYWMDKYIKLLEKFNEALRNDNSVKTE